MSLEFINGVLPVDPDNERAPLPEMVEDMVAREIARITGKSL